MEEVAAVNANPINPAEFAEKWALFDPQVRRPAVGAAILLGLQGGIMLLSGWSYGYSRAACALDRRPDS
jgi:hypothetical protein